MTRADLLHFIEVQFGEALAAVGIKMIDTHDNLSYVIDDALRCQDEEAIYVRATQEVAQLIADRQAAQDPTPTEE